MKCTCPTQRPNARDPTQPIFHWKWGLRLLPNAKKSTQKNEMYMADAKNWRHPTPEIPTCWYILRWVTPKCWRRGHCPTPAPDARYFAFWWNIGLRHTNTYAYNHCYRFHLFLRYSKCHGPRRDVFRAPLR